MRSAIRDDFARLERRRGSQQLMHVEARSEKPLDEEAPPLSPPGRSLLARLLGR